MATLPKPINDIWLMLAILRRINRRFGNPMRNARPRDTEAQAWDEWTQGLQSQGVSVIPIDWETMKNLIDGLNAPEPHESKVNLCKCSKCGGAFGKAFAKHDAKGNSICRSCAETPTITNDSDDTPRGAD